MVPIPGIGPGSPPYQGGALPLSETGGWGGGPRGDHRDRRGDAPSDLRLLDLADQGLAVPLDELHHLEHLVRPAGEGADLPARQLRRAVPVEIERVHERVAAAALAPGG